MPIWSASRVPTACITCHSPAGIIAENDLAFQLDLESGPSTDEADHVESYREILFTTNQQQVVGGALVVVMVDDPDDPILDINGVPVLINGVPQFNQIPATVSSPMRSSGSRDGRFMSTMNGSHAGNLTPDELRLIAEWLDLGGQYFNNPFDSTAPQN